MIVVNTDTKKLFIKPLITWFAWPEAGNNIPSLVVYSYPKMLKNAPICMSSGKKTGGKILILFGVKKASFKYQ